MLAGMLLLSVAAALGSAVIVWVLAGFWWAFATYVLVGTGTVLLIGLVRALDPAPGPERRRLVDSKVAG